MEQPNNSNISCTLFKEIPYESLKNLINTKKIPQIFQSRILLSSKLFTPRNLQSNNDTFKFKYYFQYQNRNHIFKEEIKFRRKKIWEIKLSRKYLPSRYLLLQMFFSPRYSLVLGVSQSPYFNFITHWFWSTVKSMQ